MDYSNKRVLFYDRGLFCYVAEKLAETFGAVYYYVPTRGAFPSSDKDMVGTGLEGVERIYNFFDYVKEADLVVFPDCYDGPLQEYLRSQGVPVWGSGYTDKFELDRWGTHKLLDSLGMPTPKSELIEGVENLRLHLAEHDDLYVKTSYFRGDFESFHHERYELTKPRLDELAHRLGPRQNFIQFIVEEPVEGVEVGYDGYHVNGVFGSVGAFGYEIKDTGFVGQVRDYRDLPECLKETTQVLSSYLKGVSASVSNEVRVGENGKPYLIDPTMRMASPPTESLVEVFDNWNEVMYEGARGNLVEFTSKAKYFAQVILRSHWVEDGWLPVYYPKSLDSRVKLRNKVVLDNQVYVCSQGYPEFGSVIGLGNTLESAIKECMINVKKVESLDLEFEENVFEKALDAIAEGEKFGINW